MMIFLLFYYFQYYKINFAIVVRPRCHVKYDLMDIPIINHGTINKTISKHEKVILWFFSILLIAIIV
jgi:hypothetical protein